MILTNPNNPTETFTLGKRGRRPLWVKDALAALNNTTIPETIPQTIPQTVPETTINTWDDVHTFLKNNPQIPNEDITQTLSQILQNNLKTFDWDSFYQNFEQTIKNDPDMIPSMVPILTTLIQNNPQLMKNLIDENNKSKQFKKIIYEALDKYDSELNTFCAQTIIKEPDVVISMIIDNDQVQEIEDGPENCQTIYDSIIDHYKDNKMDNEMFFNWINDLPWWEREELVKKINQKFPLK
jgi:hypothetical protein